MKILFDLFGEGKDLNALQMSCRGIVVFIIALILIRISGRRSFGIRTPLDNIISITLGAVLSRAIVGASDFIAVIAACFTIVCFHRICSWLIVHNPFFSSLLEGNKIILFEEGRFMNKDLDRALVSKEDIIWGIRKTALTDDLEKIDRIYMESNGEITVIRK
jgi:uncharacterized membrane protein YcaP (DUF421 family)